MAAERLSVTFHGRVQGVGFRYGTEQTATRFAVKGFVQNRSDGSVLLVAEGERRELASFLAAVLERFEDNVSDHSVDWAAPSGQFSSFEVKH